MEYMTRILTIRKDVQTGAIISLTEAIAVGIFRFQVYIENIRLTSYKAEEETIKNIANQQRNLTRDRSIASAEEHSLTSNIKQLDNQLMEMRKEHDDVAVKCLTFGAFLGCNSANVTKKVRDYNPNGRGAQA